MDFECLRGSMGKSGLQILVKSYIEHKCFKIAVCYDKPPLFQGKMYPLNMFQTLWNTLENDTAWSIRALDKRS